MIECISINIVKINANKYKYISMRNRLNCHVFPECACDEFVAVFRRSWLRLASTLRAIALLVQRGTIYLNGCPLSWGLRILLMLAESFSWIFISHKIILSSRRK